MMKDRNGAKPVPGPTIRMGVEGSSGSLKSGFFEMNTKACFPTDRRCGSYGFSEEFKRARID